MMRPPVLLSMAKAAAYLGDIQSAQHLLATLEGTLACDIAHIEAAIDAHDVELLQTKWHQLKGFTPVFCTDVLVEEISQTERLCKTTSTDSSQNNALQASTDLLTQLKQLQSEVLAQLASPPPP